jgi:hypothetical protein
MGKIATPNPVHKTPDKILKICPYKMERSSVDGRVRINHKKEFWIGHMTDIT